jgi:mycoredoxin
LRENSEATNVQNDELLLYGTSWCGLSRHIQRVLDQHGIAYRYINIDQDPAAEEIVKQINRGFRSVPTIVFADGSTLTEPGAQELLDKLRRED